MNLPIYQLKSSVELTSYEFISEGRNGLIHKRIQFTLINREDVFILAFGDKNQETGEIDDLVISNNGDSEKVLATVASAVYAFSDKYPNAWIFVAGSTPSRTRLYQMGISKFYKGLTEEFEIFGQIGGGWEKFVARRNYNAFLAKKK